MQLFPGVPTIWRDKPVVMQGKVWNGTQAERKTYGDFERETRLLFKAFMEVYHDRATAALSSSRRSYGPGVGVGPGHGP